jgi:hypothetical protein
MIRVCISPGAGPRRPSAMRNAACANAAPVLRLIAHPTTGLACPTSNAAHYPQPSAVHRYVMSPA